MQQSTPDTDQKMRLAIYHSPPVDGPLFGLAAAWLGRDPREAVSIRQPVASDIDAGCMVELTADARRYGFHATIVAPFRLAEGRSVEELEAEIAQFCSGRIEVEIPRLVLGRLGPFFALVPGTQVQPLLDLESACVDHFNGWKAPLSPSDIARRNPDALTARQREYLDRYGYPYVKAEFRYHMTLTGPVPESEAEMFRNAIETHFETVLDRPYLVDSLALFVEPAPGSPFQLRSSFPLGRRKT
jgi:putative phosphonate metabolism protein